ncbi:MAG: ADP/ATP-dependent (S)-NAD(P)H-hydrate dehydratase, partial [Myxococcota bacterium]
VVVLKGAGTVIADPDGGVSVLDVGNPGMATGGTGDVLAGMIGGLLAQGLEPVRAAQAGALWHGAAGDLAASQRGVESMIASDVLEYLGDVLVDWAR